MSKTINVDYISCVRKTYNGVLEYREIPVKKTYQKLLRDLEEMVKDSGKTLLDLQSRVLRIHFPKQYYHVCMPHRYSDSYITGPKLPEVITPTEYKKICAQKKESLRAEYKKALKCGECFDVDAAYIEFVDGLKADYFEKVQDFINADQYMSALEKVKGSSRNLMYSTEDIGRTTYEYPINDDIVFEVKTNFGYGRSAFFYVNLTYKGIKIIPYSDIVRYYYANMVEFGKFTRQYVPQHKSWPLSLNFVVETANLAQGNPDNFVQTWIKNELEGMMAGLRKLRLNPNKVIKSFQDANDEMAENYVSVANFQPKDRRLYRVYPYEMSIAYMAYKISGALHFMDNLTQLSEIYGFVKVAIEELKSINRSILPEVKEALREVRKHIRRLEKKVAILEKKINDLEKKEEKYANALKKLLQNADTKDRDSIKIKFKKENPMYVEILDELSSLYPEVRELYAILRDRQVFESELDDAERLIEQEAVPN